MSKRAAGDVRISRHLPFDLPPPIVLFFSQLRDRQEIREMFFFS
jgi:hypothetical protein